MQDKSETIPSLSRGMSGGNNPPFRSSMSSLLSRHPVPNNDHGPPSIMRSVTTAPKYNRTASNNGAKYEPQTCSPVRDWRMFMSIEERQTVRTKIYDAYTKTCGNYKELLDSVCAIEEELLHVAAPSRLDYFKSGFEFESRIVAKQKQLGKREARSSVDDQALKKPRNT